LVKQKTKQKEEIQKEPVRAKCDVVSGEFCNGLLMHLSDPNMKTRRGIMTLTLITDDCVIYGSQPVFFCSKFPNGTFMNYCPWCGAGFKSWNQHALARANKEVE
jgi:hypothetical protein